MSNHAAVISSVTPIREGSKFIDSREFDIYESKRGTLGLPSDWVSIQNTGYITIKEQYAKEHGLEKMTHAMVAFDAKRNMIAIRFGNQQLAKSTLFIGREHGNGNMRLMIKRCLEKFDRKSALGKKYQISLCHDASGNQWYCIELDRPC